MSDIFSDLKREPIGDAMQPIGKGVAPLPVLRLASQNEECTLEGVLSVMLVAQDPAGDPKNHRPMASDQGSEGVLIVVLHEPAHEPAVGLVGHGRWAYQSANMLDDSVQLPGCHWRTPLSLNPHY